MFHHLLRAAGARPVAHHYGRQETIICDALVPLADHKAGGSPVAYIKGARADVSPVTLKKWPICQQDEATVNLARYVSRFE